MALIQGCYFKVIQPNEQEQTEQEQTEQDQEQTEPGEPTTQKAINQPITDYKGL